MAFSRNKPLANAGFTLMELLIAVAIVIIVATVAVPSMRSFIDEHTSAAARDDFNAAIVLAQQEALRTKQQTILCPSTNGTSCASAWGEKTGWLVYRNMGTGTISAADIVVSRQSSTAKKIISTNVALTFSGTGHASVAQYILCTSSSSNDAYTISITRSGRMNHASSTPSDCV